MSCHQDVAELAVLVGLAGLERLAVDHGDGCLETGFQSGEIAQLEKATGLGVLARATVSPEAHRKAAAMPCLIVASALDQEGIVRSIASALHEVGINIVGRSRKYQAHDENGDYHLGDQVEIAEGRPISKTKSWFVTRLIKKAGLV